MSDLGTPAIGIITSGLDPDTLALETIDFVYTQLPTWRDDPFRLNEKSENKLNLQLCKFLDSNARNSFPMVRFNHEEYQSGRSSVDISASPVDVVNFKANFYSRYDTITVFECKRLPAPSLAREKEYVTGETIEHKNGGIQRFKLGLHGANHDIVAMIGYLQEGSANDWHDKINKWIEELSNGTITDVCVWNVSEMLNKLEICSSKGTANCRSTHNRSGAVKSDKILICHLWVTMHL